MDDTTARFLIIINAAINGYMTGVLLLYRRAYKTYTGFDLWIAASSILTLGYGFLAARDYLPIPISASISNSLIALALVLRLEGLKLYVGRAATWKLTLWLLGIHIVTQIYFAFFVVNMSYRVIGNAITILLITIPMIYLLLFRMPRIIRLLSTFFGIVAAMSSISFLIRLLLYQAWIGDYNPLSADIWNVLIYAGLIILEINWHICILTLNSQRMHSEIQNLSKRLEHLAFLDPLTGIYNRRKFIEIGNDEIARARRYHTPLTLLIFDLNKFKHVNDTHGHLFGDQVLLTVTAICQRTIRQQDVLGRFGGDEFLILLPQTSHDETVIIADRINTTIQQTSFPWSTDLLVSISYGIAELAPDDKELGDLIHRADYLLYEMKYRQRVPAQT